MAGSLKYFRYTADDGTNFALLADESNIETVNDTETQPITPAVKYKVPSNLKARTATFQSADGLIRREVVVLNTTRFGALDGTFSYTDGTSGVAVFLRSLNGERVQLPGLSDTGQLDGDAD
jgi:hypothetical protein